MPTEMKCSHCGAKNPLTSMFCRECGKKIDFSKLKPADIDQSGVHIGGSALKLIRLVISLGVIAGAGLTLWPRTTTATLGDNVALREGRMKIIRLYDAAENGIGMKGAVSEAEINAYLARLLQENQEKGQAETSADLESITVDIGEETVTVLSVARLRFLRISYLLEGVPEAGENGFVFTTRKAQVGHLPVPGPGRKWVEQRVASIFNEMPSERAILDGSSAFRLKDDNLWIMIRQK